MTNDELLDALEDERENFLKAIDGLSDEELQEPALAGGWSVKDVIIHISAWEAELVKLLWQVKQGEPPSTVHFSNVEVDARNLEWFTAYHDRPLPRVLDDFAAVRKQTVRRVEGLNDEDLNDPQRYTWLKGRPLWEWVAGDSFEHDAEHAAQIKEWRSHFPA
jgi:hypothetical protein